MPMVPLLKQHKMSRLIWFPTDRDGKFDRRFAHIISSSPTPTPLSSTATSTTLPMSSTDAKQVNEDLKYGTNGEQSNGSEDNGTSRATLRLRSTLAQIPLADADARNSGKNGSSPNEDDKYLNAVEHEPQQGSTPNSNNKNRDNTSGQSRKSSHGTYTFVNGRTIYVPPPIKPDGTEGSVNDDEEDEQFLKRRPRCLTVVSHWHDILHLIQQDLQVSAGKLPSSK